MDGDRFHAVCRTLFSSRSRRGFLGLGAAGGLAAVFAVLDAEAGKKKRKRRRKRGGGRGGGACPPPCPANMACVKRKCVAAADVCAGSTGICTAAPTPCGASDTGETCGCEQSVEGNTICIDGANPCPLAVECTSSQDCVDKLDIRYVCQEAKTNTSGQFCGCGFGTATGRVCVARCDNPG
jgi:hypothetical protein